MQEAERRFHEIAARILRPISGVRFDPSVSSSAQPYQRWASAAALSLRQRRRLHTGLGRRPRICRAQSCLVETAKRNVQKRDQKLRHCLELQCPDVLSIVVSIAVPHVAQ